MQRKKINKSFVKSLIKAIDILEFISERDGYVGITEISNNLKMDKTTIYRILSTLKEKALVEQSLESKKYRIGSKILELSSNYLYKSNIIGISKPHLINLMEMTKETVHLGIMNDTHVVYLDKIESNQTVRMVSKIGKTADVYSTAMGKSILAFSPEEQSDGIIQKIKFHKHTKNTIVSIDLLKMHLKEVRNRGYAIDYEENENEVRCVAAPILKDDIAIASVSVSGPSYRINDEKISEISSLVINTANKISKELTNIEV